MTGNSEHQGLGFASTSGPQDRKQPRHPTLDGLPPEIRRHLLSILDLSQLKALVHSSPNFHKQYYYERKYLLCRSLEQTLRGATVDAYAVHILETRDVSPKENTSAFFRAYSENTLHRFRPLVEELTQDEAAFYFRYVKPVLECFAQQARDNLEKMPPSGLHVSKTDLTLTDMETLRLARAIYRFQMLCHLADPVDRAIRLSREQTVQKLLLILEPWEVEELFSFYQFSWSVYDKIFKDIFWDVHPDNPKFEDQGRPPTPDGAFELNNESKFGSPIKFTPAYVTVKTNLTSK